MLVSEKMLPELHRLFSLLNNHFYNGELGEPEIIINDEKRKNAFDWCRIKKIINDSGNENYQMSIVGEFFHNRTKEHVVEMLLHEMSHLYNIKHGINDCTRKNTYHNSKFLSTAQKHGLEVKRDTAHGWAYTSLSEQTKEFLTTISINEDAIRLAYANIGKNAGKDGEKKGNSRKYQCPECGMSVRATKEVNIVCGDCNVQMISERSLKQTKERSSDQLSPRESIKSFQEDKVSTPQSREHIFNRVKKTRFGFHEPPMK